MVRRFIKNSAWVLGSNVFSRFINLITLGFLARVLSPDHLGYYNAVQNTGNYINMMSSFGTLVVIQRVGAKITELGKKLVSELFSNAFTVYILINVFAGLVLLLFPVQMFELLLDSNGNLNFITIIAIVVVLNALGQIPLYLIQGLEEFSLFSLRNSMSTVVVLLITALFIAILEDNLTASLYGLAAAYFINVILTGIVFYKVVKKYDLNIRLSFNGRILKSVLKQGFIYYIGNTFFVAVVGLVIISLFFKYLSPFEYGFTRIGNAFAILLSVVPSAMQPVTISMLSINNNRNDYIKSLQIRAIPFASTLLLVVISFNMEIMLKLLFGDQYAEAKDIVFGMILVHIPFIYQGLINNYQIGAGHLNFVGVVAILGCASMIIFAFLLMPKYGVIGYFVAMYVSTFIGLSLLSFREYYNKTALLAEDRHSILLIAAMIGLSYLGMYFTPDILRIPMTILIVCLSSLFFWRWCMMPDERTFLTYQAAKLSPKSLFRK